MAYQLDSIYRNATHYQCCRLSLASFGGINMIYERRFWISTLTITIFMSLFYVLNMSWEAVNYSDWLGFEVVTGGNYFQNWTWQVVLSTALLLYWSINYSFSIQKTVRFGASGQLGRAIIRRTYILAVVFGLIYWIMPYFRIWFFNPTETQLVNFSFIWFLQVVISILWSLIIVNLTLLVYSYWHQSTIIIGLVVLIIVVTSLHFGPLSQSLLSDTQVTAMLNNQSYRSGIIRAMLTIILIVVILYILKVWFLRSFRRWEWVK